MEQSALLCISAKKKNRFHSNFRPQGIAKHTYADVYLPFDGGLVERREVPVVPGIGVSPVGQQERDHLSVPKRGRIVEGDQPT